MSGVTVGRRGSCPSILTVDDDGVATAVGRGRVVVTARHEGLRASLELTVDYPEDLDEDGLPDQFERGNGLDIADAGDAFEDIDGDGLTNIEEFEVGTDIRSPDSDGDGVLDSEEVRLGTNPTKADTDEDGLLDGEEARIGTDPLQRDSDGDGIDDGTELSVDLDPTVPDPTTTIGGIVVDAAGAAVAGATVVTLDRYVETTDEGGAFEIEHVPANRGDLIVEARLIVDGRVNDGASAAVAPIVAGITDVGIIRLQPVIGLVGGVVQSPRGEPVPNARVFVEAGGELRATNSDVSGFYEVTRIAGGSILVTATDPGTGLRGQSTGLLPEGESTVINVRLTAAGTIRGTVFQRDLVTPAGEGVEVELAGPSRATTFTDRFGDYRFDFIPLGAYSVVASDDEGNRGLALGTITGTNQTIDIDVRYLGRGAVAGAVFSSTGDPVANATVRLTSRSIFGGRFDLVTDLQGNFVFDDVFVGPIELYASDPARGLAGNAAGSLAADGERVSIPVILQPAGTITGQVLEADNVTPVPGATVTLSPSGRSTAADPNGFYAFDNVPTRNYDVSASSPVNGDRGKTSALLRVAGEIVDVDVRLNGVGDVTVTVIDAAGAVVSEVQVTVRGQGVFGGRVDGFTDVDGVYSTQNFLAGPITVTALDPLTSLGGDTATVLLPGESLVVTVQLEPAGDITGRVVAADGLTPVPNITVELSPLNRSVVTAADGEFRFDSVPLARQPYSLEARDSNRSLRAGAAGIALAAHADVADVELVLTGAGVVAGTIFNPDETPASSARVALQSAVNGSRSRVTLTDVNGAYSFGEVPEGVFTVTASIAALRYAGAAGGAITFDGERFGLDITMLENQAPPPSGGGSTTLARNYDGNNNLYRFELDGALRDGTTAVFRGDGSNANRDGAVLLLGSPGEAKTRFEALLASTDATGRNAAVSGTGPGGLNVLRRAYTPADGYFTRYLEIFSNATAQAITVDVRVRTHLRFMNITRNGFTATETPAVVASSTGDAGLEVAGALGDTWVALDDSIDADPFRETNIPDVVSVFRGPGNTAATGARYEPIFDGGGHGRLDIDYGGLVVPSGGTVAIMHFVSQQISRPGAAATGGRLVQLPPEALAGLQVGEIMAIANFDVPADGTSALDPLELDGVVTGSVFEGDGETLVNNAQVRFQSNDPIFGRIHEVRSNADGVYAAAATLTNNGRTVIVPRAGYELNARHPVSDIDADPVDGIFGAGAQTSLQDLIFGNTGIVFGDVRRPDTTVVSSGTVRIPSAGLLFRTLTSAIAVDGRYAFVGVPAGFYTLIAGLVDPRGTGLSQTVGAQVIAGERNEINIVLAPTGGVSGRVLSGGGIPVPDVRVTIRGPGGFQRSVDSGSGGDFSFLDLPEATFTLSAREPHTNIESTAIVEVSPEEAAFVDIQLVELGRIEIVADYQGGLGAVVGAPVQVQSDLLGSGFRSKGTTDIFGRLVVPNVPVGDFVVRVLNPFNNALRATESGTVAGEGSSHRSRCWCHSTSRRRSRSPSRSTARCSPVAASSRCGPTRPTTTASSASSSASTGR